VVLNGNDHDKDDSKSSVLSIIRTMSIHKMKIECNVFTYINRSEDGINFTQLMLKLTVLIRHIPIIMLGDHPKMVILFDGNDGGMNITKGEGTRFIKQYQ
jgi:hypothetical protein